MIASTALSSRLWSLLICGLVLGLSLPACNSGNTSSGAEVIEPRLVKTANGDRSFTGILVNQGSSTLSIAQVEVALYDDEGAQVETVRIDVKDIPPQDSVNFKETIDSDRPFSQAQVQSILTP